ncbi:MAG: hypothetical protein O3C28_15100 [Proteobacteria bacterium]|nr:hypothetical protein [Pseudomonadota bacterium]
MRALTEIEQRLDDIIVAHGEPTSTDELLRCGEEVLEHWVAAKNLQPTMNKQEGFRLLALHRQGAQGDASFNACRETCRELVYHYNLMAELDDNPNERNACLQMMALVANHLVLFVSGKMAEAGLGDFCCSSKPLHGENIQISEISDA